MFANALPESIIKRLSIRARELGAINLGQGIPSFPTAPHIIEAARQSLNDPTIGVYPNFLGEIELRSAIIDKLNAIYGLQLTAGDNVVITVGAMEGTAASIFSLLKNSDRVAIITPDYCNHIPQILLARGVPVEIQMVEKEAWQLPLEQIEQEAKIGLKLLILTNPNNPTGALFSADEIRKVIQLANKYNFWILSDETYSYLTYDEPMTSLLDFWNESDKLFVVRSFSKEYAMTGWRVGYVIAGKTAISSIAKVHDALTGCVPKISQRAALAAVTGSQDIVKEYQDALKRRRAAVSRYLDEINDVFSYSIPKGAYYIFPRFNLNISSERLAEELLTKAKVAVISGNAFGMGGEHHIRISYAVSEETLTDGLQRIIEYVREYGKKTSTV